MAMLSDTAQPGGAERGLSGHAGLENTTLPLVQCPLGAAGWDRRPLLWGDLEKGLGEPCSASVHLALVGVISMYLMSGGRKRRVTIQCLLGNPNPNPWCWRLWEGYTQPRLPDPPGLALHAACQDLPWVLPVAAAVFAADSRENHPT